MEFKPKPKTAVPQAQTATKPSGWQPKPTTPELQPVGKTGPWRRSMGLKFPDAREDVQPEAAAETEAAAKVVGNTATPAAAKPVAAKPVFTKLTDQQVKDAQAWYATKKDQYTPEVLKQIQKKLGIAQTGKADVAMIQAVAKWQAVNKPLPIDGKQGKYLINGKADALMLESIFPSGLAKAEIMDDYVESMRKLIKEWPKLDQDSRQERVKTVILDILKRAGVPEVTIVSAELSEGTSGAFSLTDQTLTINVSLLKKASLSQKDAKDFVDTIYHEARHAEQSFLIARLRSSNTSELIKNGFSESSIALAKKNSIALGSIDGIKAEALYQNIFGEEKLFRNSVMKSLNLTGNSSKVILYLYSKATDIHERRMKLYGLMEKTKDDTEKKKIYKEIQLQNRMYDFVISLIDSMSSGSKSIWDAYHNLLGEADAFQVGAAAGEKYGSVK